MSEDPQEDSKKKTGFSFNTVVIRRTERVGPSTLPVYVEKPVKKVTKKAIERRSHYKKSLADVPFEIQ